VLMEQYLRVPAPGRASVAGAFTWSATILRHLRALVNA